MQVYFLNDAVLLFVAIIIRLEVADIGDSAFINLTQKEMILPYIQIFVICTDDSNKPKDVGQWVQKHKIYNVLGVINSSKVDGTVGYKLKEVEPSLPYETYHESRFELFFEPVNLN